MKKRKLSSVTKKQIANEAKEKKGINMKKVPECLAQEGYDKLEDKIPDYLACPVCKELIVSPAMFKCGHSVCQLCSFAATDYQVPCPVCKGTSDRPVVNYMVKSIVEAQFPKEAKKRQKDVEILTECKEKLRNYVLSTRHADLLESFQALMESTPVITVQQLYEELQKKKSLKGITEAEVKFFVAALNIQKNWGVYLIVGQHICVRKVENIVKWAQEHPVEKKWIPLVSLGANSAVLQDVAKLFNVDIGDPLPLQDWQTAPAHWIRDLNIELKERSPRSTLMVQLLGQHNILYDDSPSDSEANDDHCHCAHCEADDDNI
jgi:hypothetical protein